MTPDSSGITDFLSQISGLLALTCVAGLMWILLTAIVAQRAAERRRRAKHGMEPLPSLYVQAGQWLRDRFGGASSPQTSDSAPVPMPAREHIPPREQARPSSSIPVPDLALLTGDLGGAARDAGWDERYDAPDETGEISPEPFLGGDLPDDEADEEAASTFEDEAHEAFDESLDAADATTEEYADALQDAAEEVEEIAASVTAPESPAESAPAPHDSVEVLRVWRDLADGQLVLEIGGRRFSSLQELQQADLVRRFEGIVRELQGLSGQSRSDDRPRPAPPGEPVPPAARQGGILRQMTRVAMGQGTTPGEPVAPLTIADQIEELLQSRLVEMPAYRQREIHVRPSLSGGVRIEVDGQYFEKVADVTDEDVRALLQEVVEDWQRTQ